MRSAVGDDQAVRMFQGSQEFSFKFITNHLGVTDNSSLKCLLLSYHFKINSDTLCGTYFLNLHVMSSESFPSFDGRTIGITISQFLTPWKPYL